jgi:hypothetical protein
MIQKNRVTTRLTFSSWASCVESRSFVKCSWLRRSVGISISKCLLFSCRCEIQVNASAPTNSICRAFSTLFFLERFLQGHVFIYRDICSLLLVPVQIIVCNWLNGWFYYFAPWISTLYALVGMYHVCRVKYNLACVFVEHSLTVTNQFQYNTFRFFSWNSMYQSETLNRVVCSMTTSFEYNMGLYRFCTRNFFVPKWDVESSGRSSGNPIRK